MASSRHARRAARVHRKGLEVSKSAIWCDRSLVVLPFYLALVISEADYYRECEEMKIPIADRGIWKREEANATTSFFPDCIGTDGKKFKAVIVGIEPRDQDGIVAAGLLVHEAVHVFQKYCELVGESRPSLEFEAYSIQWIAQSLMWSYRDQVFPQPSKE